MRQAQVWKASQDLQRADAPSDASDIKLRCALCGKGFDTRPDAKPMALRSPVGDVLMHKLIPSAGRGRSGNHRSHFPFCSDLCRFQACIPTLKREELEECATFANVRHKVTVLHATGVPTLDAIRVVEQSCPSLIERNWARVLKHSYKSGKEHIYSIMYARDPAVVLFLDTTERDLCMQEWRQAAFGCMAMGSRCNRQMAIALGSDLRVSRKLSDAQIRGILARRGIMESAISQGNESVKEGTDSLVEFYTSFIDGRDSMDFMSSWGAILSGEVEVVKAIMGWRAYHDIPKLGEFKAYFIGKCLRHRFHHIQVRPLGQTYVKNK